MKRRTHSRGSLRWATLLDRRELVAMFVSRLRLSLIVCLVLVLSACNRQPAEERATLTDVGAERAAATVPPPAATQTPVLPAIAATVSPVASGTVAPSPTSVPTSEPTPSSGELFALTRVHWEPVETEDNETARRISELTYPITRLEASPDGRWLAASLALDRSGTTADAVIDIEEGALWWVNKESFLGGSYRWLPDGRLLWVDENLDVFIGDNEDRRSLDPPVPIASIVYASSGIAFGVEANSLVLWRVDVESGQWDPVVNPQPPREGYLGGYFGLSRDGTHALAFQAGQMWHIPAEMGAAARPLSDLQRALTILGSGMPAEPPQQLAETPYWLIPLPFQIVEEGVEMAGVVVDTRDGAVLQSEDLGLPGDLYLQSYDLSPGGQWLSVTAAERDTQQPTALYLVAADNLAAEPLAGADHEVAGWHADPPAVILRNRETGALSLQRLPADGEPDPIQLAANGDLIATAPGTIFAARTDNGMEIMRFDLSGNLVDSLTLPLQNAIVRTATAAGDRLLIAVESCTGGEGDCGQRSGRGGTSIPGTNCERTEGVCAYFIIDWRSTTPGSHQEDAPLEPALTGSRILPYRWSPDGDTLALWTWTPEEIAIDYTYPPGTLRFLDAAAGRFCDSPVPVAYPYFTSTLLWDADGVAWALNAEGEIVAIQPCATSPAGVLVLPEKVFSITAAPDGLLLVNDGSGQVTRSAHGGEPGRLLLTGPSADFIYDVHEGKIVALEGRVVPGVYSPDAARLAVSTAQEGLPNRVQTQIVNLETGEVENDFSWQAQPGEGTLPEPLWLNDETLLTMATAFGRPLLARADGDVIDVSEAFFEGACRDELCEVRAARLNSSYVYHILLKPASANVWTLYHPEQGVVEGLPRIVRPVFSPDGRWLAGIVEEDGDSKLWLRPVDGDAPQINTPSPALSNVPLAWSPDSAHVAYATSNAITVTNIEPTISDNAWSTGAYSAISTLWSPNSAGMAVQAYMLDSSANAIEALFIFEVP